jgi:hypothetical protein
MTTPPGAPDMILHMPLSRAINMKISEAMDLGSKGEIAASYALRALNLPIIEEAMMMCVDASQALAEVGYAARSGDLLKKANKLRDRAAFVRRNNL